MYATSAMKILIMTPLTYQVLITRLLLKSALEKKCDHNFIALQLINQYTNKMSFYRD